MRFRPSIAARERARRSNGEFGTQEHTDPGIVALDPNRTWDPYPAASSNTVQGVSAYEMYPAPLVERTTETVLFQGQSVQVRHTSVVPSKRVPLPWELPWETDVDVDLTQAQFDAAADRADKDWFKTHPTAPAAEPAVDVEEVWRRIAPTRWTPSHDFQDRTDDGF